MPNCAPGLAAARTPVLCVLRTKATCRGSSIATAVRSMTTRSACATTSPGSADDGRPASRRPAFPPRAEMAERASRAVASAPPGTRTMTGIPSRRAGNSAAWPGVISSAMHAPQTGSSASANPVAIARHEPSPGPEPAPPPGAPIRRRRIMRVWSCPQTVPDMRCLAVCQDELVIRMLDEILLPSFEVEFIVESRPLARRLHDAGVDVDRRRPAAHRHLPQGRHRPQHLRHHRRQRQAQPQEDPRSGARRRRHAGLRPRHRRRDARQARRRAAQPSFPTSPTSSMSELFGGPLLTEFSRSLTRARVQQYQRYFSDADRVLILLHNDPDPDAMASGLALRNVLRRTKTTAIIGAIQGVTRPENLRMVNLLDIHVEPITPASLERVRPHRDGRRAAALLRRADRSRRPRRSIIIPSSPATPRCSRTSAPTTARPRTILTEHLRAVDVEHLRAHRDGDALRDQVRHAVLQPPDQPRRPRGVLVPLSAGRRRADPQDGRARKSRSSASTT